MTEQTLMTGSAVDPVAAFRAALARRGAGEGRPDLTDYLPPPGSAGRSRALADLIRAEMNHDWAVGNPEAVQSYLRRYPELADSPEALTLVALEEYRERLTAGQSVRPEEYARHYGVDTGGWPRPPAATERVGGRLGKPSGDAQLENRRGSSAAFTQQSGRPAPPAPPAPQAPQAADEFPKAGDRYLGFELTGELGRGAFGRVFLGRQGELADREVVLKISTDLMGEPNTLAQLQHTNIVPVYSVHRDRPFQAVCMPYLGSVTFEDVIGELRRGGRMPDSGKALVSTFQDIRGRKTRETVLRGMSQTAVPGQTVQDFGPPTAANKPGRTREILKRLEGSTYTGAVLWLTARLADGLAHAHERGVLHRDMKPANVLLTDEGQPMLLDFNLALDAAGRRDPSGSSMGGTLPYMAPEHLEAFRKSRLEAGRARTGGLAEALAGDPHAPTDYEVGAEVVEQSDIYSLGLILFEMLAGRPPFSQPDGPVDQMLRSMVKGRLVAPPALCPLNPEVTPAVEAIVHKCMAPRPADRYRTARELQEDIKAHLADRPLRYAKERSARERYRKWARRHPRLTSATTVGVVAVALLAGAGWAVYDYKQRIARHQAAEQFRLFHEAKMDLEPAMAALPADAKVGADISDKGRALLDRYAVFDGTPWVRADAVSRLDPHARHRLRTDVGDILLMMARRTSWGGADKPGRLRKALRLNRLAAESYPPDAVPKTVGNQRRHLIWLLGGKRGEMPAAPTVDRDDLPARDLYLSAAGWMWRNDPERALAMAEMATEVDPELAPAWHLIGDCRSAFGDLKQAESAYNVAVALRPSSPWTYFQRGAVRMRLGLYRAAAADFTKAVDRKTDLAAAMVNRAVCLRHLKQYKDALKDLDKAFDLDSGLTRVFFIRQTIHIAMGDKKSAAAARKRGMSLKPGDEMSWIVRAWEAKKAGFLIQAADDLDQALELNPRSETALQNRMEILDLLGRTRDSLKAHDDKLELYPHDAGTWASRAVLNARLGQRKAAHEDIAKAMKYGPGPLALYQLACAYSLTSRQDKDDRRKAMQMLAIALTRGGGLEYVDRDKDLDPIRAETDFGPIVKAAKTLKASRVKAD